MTFHALRRGAWEMVRRERWLALLFVATLVVLAGEALALARAIPPRDEPITLHYTTSFGVDLIGSRGRMYLLPGFGALVLLVNAILGVLFARRDRVLGYVLIACAFVFSLFLGLGVYTLIVQNR